MYKLELTVLKGLDVVVYESSYALIYDLFANRYIQKKQIDHFDQLKSFLQQYQVPGEDLTAVRRLVKLYIDDWKQWEDPEYSSLILLSKIDKQEILFLVDGRLILDLTAFIQINPESRISFVDKLRINQLTFN